MEVLNQNTKIVKKDNLIYVKFNGYEGNFAASCIICQEHISIVLHIKSYNIAGPIAQKIIKKVDEVIEAAENYEYYSINPVFYAFFNDIKGVIESVTGISDVDKCEHISIYYHEYN